ncbi:isocitrate lyase/phosphoenolpyruvate mutase family protein [Streptomyces sp. Edi4]|uniref:isocitrate lyase/PEP mutase family protein n=1 Tax=Streptomyces sp. Edi4 TaxID=3162527 RepID=UPI003305B315
MASQRDKIAAFRSSHTSDSPLVLANVWDVAGARLAVAAGATALATTSAGISWSAGCADGDHMSGEAALDAVARIIGAVPVPVSADIESGYGRGPREVASTVAAVIAAGAAGINIEDSCPERPGTLRPVAEQAQRIAAARAAADTAGLPVYINARTDAWWSSVGEPATRVEESVERARAYLAAGADGIFVPGVRDAATISALTGAIDAPVNVLVGPGALGVKELAALGVARVTIGSSLAAAAYAVVRRAVERLVTEGTYEPLAGGITYQEFNELMG